ncbi:MAG: TetR/AcrR family transcriptional regulator [Bacillota bacterium]|jgi:AcrR family transcriptional regulator
MLTDRKATILEAFMNLVRRFGIDKTTMQDVAREGGISVGVIYKDFANKDDLIDAYIKKIIQQVLYGCQQLVQQSKPAKELLHDLIIGFCKIIGEYVNQDRGFLQCIFGDWQVGQLQQKSFQFEGVFRNGLEPIIAAVLVKGRAEGVFVLQDVAETASYFFDAFGTYLFELGVNQKNLAEVLPKAEKLFGFIVKAIEKR